MSATVAEAALDGRAPLQPTCGFRTNVYAYAKRDLEQGDRLDGLGGFACYGLIDNCGADAAIRGSPSASPRERISPERSGAISPST